MTNEKAQSLLQEALHLFPKKRNWLFAFALFWNNCPVLEESIYVRNLFSREYLG